jgi:hypothetical protein
MKGVCVLVLLLVLSISMVGVDKVWSLPFDVNPPKCYFCCDVNFDGKIDLSDLFVVFISYGSMRNMPKWNQAADIDRNGIVDLLDIFHIVRCLLFSKC